MIDRLLIACHTTMRVPLFPVSGRSQKKGPAYSWIGHLCEQTLSGYLSQRELNPWQKHYGGSRGNNMRDDFAKHMQVSFSNFCSVP